ncbi:hypothetical protein G6F57_020379 [Rhizopus arrhizus]|nr:hypothetical protein G6F57_020379 [Rhizopus arrhizus]
MPARYDRLAHRQIWREFRCLARIADKPFGRCRRPEQEKCHCLPIASTPDDVRVEHEVSRDDDVDLVGRFERERSLDRLIPLQDLPDRIAEGLASSARQRRRGAAVV